METTVQFSRQYKWKKSLASLVFHFVFMKTTFCVSWKGKLGLQKLQKNNRYQITLKLFTDFKDYEKTKDF